MREVGRGGRVPSPAGEAALTLGSDERERLLRAARGAKGSEVCGLLLGRRRGRDVAVERVLRLGNAAVGGAAAGSCRLRPLDPLRAERAAREEGRVVVGVWHSHPAGGARPSRVDCAAAVRGWVQVIVAPAASGGSDLRAWEVEDGEPRELALRAL